VLLLGQFSTVVGCEHSWQSGSVLGGWWCCILLWVWGQPRRKATSISRTLARVQCTFSPPADSGHKPSNIHEDDDVPIKRPYNPVIAYRRQSRQYCANNGLSTWSSAFWKRASSMVVCGIYSLTSEAAGLEYSTQKDGALPLS